MDPATIAASVIALLAPYLQKATEAFAGEAGKGAASFVQEKAKAIWNRLRDSAASDPPAAEALERFAADPDVHRNEAEARMVAQLTRDKTLLDELAGTLTEIKRAAPQLRVVQKMREAEEVVGLKAKRMTRGAADVSQEIEKAKNTTGIELDEIG